MKSSTTANSQVLRSADLKEQIEQTSENDSKDLDESAKLNLDKVVPPPLVFKTENDGSAITKFEMNRERLLVKHTSHALLYIPEHRRISITSGNSVTSCPPMSSVENAHQKELMTRTASLLPPSLLDSRRRSIQIGAPAIGFMGWKLYRRRNFQSTFALDSDTCKRKPLTLVYHVKNDSSREKTPQRKLMCSVAPEVVPTPQCPTKRVSWLSVKNLQENELLGGTSAASRRNRRESAMFSLSNETLSKNGSRNNNQFGSVFQLDYISLLDRETDTPPLDTLSWSNEGAYTFHYSFFYQHLKPSDSF
uniref:Uncharacterized protein n=1 Tax=Setaria digitata TaxID=48799 RepID=A0A915PJR5_9BILA